MSKTKVITRTTTRRFVKGNIRYIITTFEDTVYNNGNIGRYNKPDIQTYKNYCKIDTSISTFSNNEDFINIHTKMF